MTCELFEDEGDGGRFGYDRDLVAEAPGSGTEAVVIKHGPNHRAEGLWRGFGADRHPSPTVFDPVGVVCVIGAERYEDHWYADEGEVDEGPVRT